MDIYIWIHIYMDIYIVQICVCIWVCVCVYESTNEAAGHQRCPLSTTGIEHSTREKLLARWNGPVGKLRGQSRIRYSLPLRGFSESGIRLASATGKHLGFLWIHVQAFMRWAKKNLNSGLFPSLRGLPT